MAVDIIFDIKQPCFSITGAVFSVSRPAVFPLQNTKSLLF